MPDHQKVGAGLTAAKSIYHACLPFPDERGHCILQPTIRCQDLALARIPGDKQLSYWMKSRRRDAPMPLQKVLIAYQRNALHLQLIRIHYSLNRGERTEEQ